MNPHRRSFWGQLQPLLKDLRYEPNSLGLIMWRDWYWAGLRRSIETVRIALADRIEAKLSHIEAPTLIVRGAKDPLVPQDWAEEATRLLSHGELKVVPDYGHCLIYSAPLELRRVIVPFLKIGPEGAPALPAFQGAVSIAWSSPNKIGSSPGSAGEAVGV